jgi:hypothetical protein
MTDSHWVRGSPEVFPLYNQSRVIPVFLAPHSTHSFEPLDLQVISSFKTCDSSLHTRLTKPQLESKLPKTLDVRPNSRYSGIERRVERLRAIRVKRPSDRRPPEVGNLPSTHSSHAKSMLGYPAIVRRKRQPVKKANQGLIPNRSTVKTFVS